ncbi:MAG: type II secretion system F family protein [Ilumatobacteraceae bacterium]
MRQGLAVVLIAIAAALVVSEISTTVRSSRWRRHVRIQVGLAAGSPARRPEWLTMTTAWSAAAAATGFAWAGPVGLGLGAVPVIVRRAQAKAEQRRRSDLLASELAPTLQLVVGNLRIGRNLPAAITEVVESAGEPLRSMLADVVTQARLGEPIDECFRRLSERENDRHLGVVASAIGLHARHGGSLVEILESVIETIREEDRLRRDIRSLTADGRLSALVLMLMPPFALAFVSLFNPRYAEPLVAEPLGRAMSVTALVLGLVGWRWLRTLSRPEVVA